MSLPERPTPNRTFKISSKRAYTELEFNPNAKGGSIGANFVTHTVTAAIMEDVYTNAVELNAGVSFHDLTHSQDFRFTIGGVRETLEGQPAIRRKFAPTLASIIVMTHWNLDRPEVVYMSGVIYEWAFRQAAENLAYQITRRSETIAPTPDVEEKKQKEISRLEARHAQYNTFAMRMRETLAEYAHQYLPDNPFYTQVCPVPDIINTATRRGIGSNGQQTQELYARVQTQGSTGKHAA